MQVPENNTRLKKAWTSGLLASVSLLAAQPAYAQAAGESDDGNGDVENDVGIPTIIVSANKREEDLQRAAVAVTAFSGEALEQFNFSQVDDLAAQTPSLQLNTEFGTTKPAVFLRGIGTNDRSVTATPSVAIYTDEVLVGLQTGQTFQLFDLEAIEVLRGPQGTLYGRNTTGGAVNFRSRLPSGSFGYDAQASVGNFGLVELEAGVDIPIAPDVLDVRVAMRYSDFAGDQRNAFNGERIGANETFSGRVIAVLRPTDTMEWRANVNFGTLEGDGIVYHFNRAQGIDAFGRDNAGKFPDDFLNGGARSVFPILGLPPIYEAPEDFWTTNVNPDQNFEEVDAFNASLTGEIELGDVTLTTITAYSTAESQSSFDSDASPLDFVTVENAEDGWSFSQELRLTSDTVSDFQWIVGGFFYIDEVDADNAFDIGRFSRDFFGAVPDPTDPTAPIRIGQDFTQEQRSLAVYGSGTYSLSERTKVTVGLRYTNDTREIDYRTFGDEAVPFPLITNDILLAVGKDLDPTFEAVTGNIIIDHEFSPDVFGYASYNRGFKSGSFSSVALFDPNTFSTVDGEDVDAFEMGLKTSAFDNRLIYNTAIFYNEFSNLQVANLLPDPTTGIPVTTLANAASASTFGIEVEITARPVPQMLISFAGSYLDATYSSFIFTEDNPATPNIDETVDLAGDRLPSAPEWSLNGFAEYEFDLTDNLKFVPRLEFTHSSRVFFQSNNNAQGGALSRPAFTVFNASARLEIDSIDTIITGWVRNLGNEQFNNVVLDLSDFGVNISTRNSQRAYGVTISTSY